MSSNYGYGVQHQGGNFPQTAGTAGYQQSSVTNTPGYQQGGYQQGASAGFQQSGSTGYQQGASGYQQASSYPSTTTPSSGYQQQQTGSSYQQGGTTYPQTGTGNSGHQQPSGGSSYQTSVSQSSPSTTMSQYPSYSQSGATYSNYGYGSYGSQSGGSNQPTQSPYSQQTGQSGGQTASQLGNRSQWNQQYGYKAGGSQQPQQQQQQQQPYQQKQQQQHPSGGQPSNQSGNQEYQRYYYQGSGGGGGGSQPGRMPPHQSSQSTANPPLPFAGSMGKSTYPPSNAPSGSGYGGSRYVNAANQYYKKKQQVPASSSQEEGHDNQAYSQYLNAYISKSHQVSSATASYSNYDQPEKPRIPFKRKAPVDPTKYYCDLCKVACSSELNFKAHTSGKAHLKKVAQPEAVVPKVAGIAMYRCEVCLCSCSGKHGIEAHLSGAKHKKSMKMLHLMNKPIPSPMTMLITTEKAPDGTLQQKSEPSDLQQGPKIKFVGGQHLSSTGELVKDDDPKKQRAYPPGIEPPAIVKDPIQELQENPALLDYKEPDPIGVELVERCKKNPTDPHIIFKCSMCDCYFNDENAKVMHCKGRRHRLNYKKHYDPTLKVEPSRADLNKQAKQKVKPKTRPPSQASGGLHPASGDGPGPDGKFSRGPSRRPEDRRQMLNFFGLPETVDDFSYWTFECEREEDQLLLAKHNMVTWSAPQYDAAEAFIEQLEKTLKQVSDQLFQEQQSQSSGAETKVKNDSLRVIRGIMAVGDYSTRTLVQGDNQIELVITCSDKPTVELLQKVTLVLEEKLHVVCPDRQFSLVSDASESNFAIHTAVDVGGTSQHLEIKVYLTCLSMRHNPRAEGEKGEKDAEEKKEEEEEANVLNKYWCSYALALQRHCQYFKNEVEGYTPTVVLLRLFKAFRKSRPEFAYCSSWVIDLLVFKVSMTVHEAYSYIGDVFKRVFECLGSGMFLPGAPGMLDPCERSPVDVTVGMTAQNREGLTATTQYIIRLMAFGKLRELLGVEIPLGLKKKQSKKEEERSEVVSSEAPPAKKPKAEE